MSKGIVETESLVLFWGGWPSQWCATRFVVDGVQYNCCEQYMMAEKAAVFGDVEALRKILDTANPRTQKALGRKVKGFDAKAWSSICRGVVYTANLARFTQNADERQLLLDTGEKTIVEASPRDRIWGIGLAPDDTRAQDPSQWQGTNWLGIALMQVRDTLRRSTGDATPEASDPELRAQLNRRKELRR